MSSTDIPVTGACEPDGETNANNGTTPDTIQQEASLPEALQQSRQSDVPTASNAPNATRDIGNPEHQGPIITKSPLDEHYVHETNTQFTSHQIPQYMGQMGFNPHIPNFASKYPHQPPNWYQQQWANQPPPWAMQQPMYPPQQWMPQQWANQPPPWIMPQPMQQYAPQNAYAVTRSRSGGSRWTQDDRARRNQAANNLPGTPVNTDPTFSTPQSRRQPPDNENTVPIAVQSAGGGPGHVRASDVNRDLTTAVNPAPGDGDSGDDSGSDDENRGNNDGDNDGDEGDRGHPSGTGGGGPPGDDPNSNNGHNDDNASVDDRSVHTETLMLSVQRCDSQCYLRQITEKEDVCRAADFL